MSESNLALSPFQFPVTNLYSSLFSGVLLSYWDNIMGPRVQRLWHGNEKLKITPELISFVSSHTLNGELCRLREEGQTDTKFYVLSDRGYIFSSSVFLGESKSGQTVFSLTFIMAIEDLNRYLELQQFLTNQIAMLVMKIRVLQEKVRFFCKFVFQTSPVLPRSAGLPHCDYWQSFSGGASLNKVGGKTMMGDLTMPFRFWETSI